MQKERHLCVELPVGEYVGEGLSVVGIAIAVQLLAVVPCDACSFWVCVAHLGELGDGGHGACFAGDYHAHASASFLMVSPLMAFR